MVLERVVAELYAGRSRRPAPRTPVAGRRPASSSSAWSIPVRSGWRARARSRPHLPSKAFRAGSRYLLDLADVCPLTPATPSSKSTTGSTGPRGSGGYDVGQPGPPDCPPHRSRRGRSSIENGGPDVNYCCFRATTTPPIGNLYLAPRRHRLRDGRWCGEHQRHRLRPLRADPRRRDEQPLARDRGREQRCR